jgi:hypothetical protein
MLNIVHRLNGRYSKEYHLLQTSTSLLFEQTVVHRGRWSQTNGWAAS